MIYVTAPLVVIPVTLDNSLNYLLNKQVNSKHNNLQHCQAYREDVLLSYAILKQIDL